MNFAVTDFDTSVVTVQVRPEPEQASDHPPQAELASGVAVSVTVVGASNRATHVSPHWIPAGEEATVPFPRPACETARAAQSVNWTARSRGELGKRALVASYAASA
jgi:hypothetical protein